MARIRTTAGETKPVASSRRAPAKSAKRGKARADNTGARGQPDVPALTVSRPELLVRGSDRDFRQLVHGLFSFLSSHETIRAGHARHIGLAGIEYTALISIAHLAQEGDVSVSAVAQHLRVTGAFITNVCQRLVTRGLIDKSTDPADRRRVVLTVTAEGRRRLETLAPTQRRINDVEFGCLGREEFVSLRGMVQRLIVSAEQATALQRYLQREDDNAGKA